MTPKDAHRLRELLIVTPNSFVHAYGGVLYLADALWQCGVKVRLLCTLQREYAHLLPQRPYPVIDLAQLPFGGAPKIRFLIRIARIMQEGLRPHTHFIFNDYDYYRQAVWLKHLRPEAQLIHYTTELLTPEEQPTIPRLRFYERHARVPDLIIDVEPHRAQRRQKRFGLDRLPMVLPNTLPAAYFPLPGPPGSLARLAGGAPLPLDRFILLYAGSAHPTMSFDRLLQAISLCPVPVFLLGFIRGDARRIEHWQRQLYVKLGSAGGRICPAVPRLDLLRALPEAGAGLIYYPPSDELSCNQLFCAPTKLYEYLAAGLPVVGSANPSLRDLLEPAELGYCAEEDSPAGLARALERTMIRYGSRASAHRLHIQAYYRDSLCFEKTSEPVLSAILATLRCTKNIKHDVLS